jgi:mRNA interferase RelE/StbE
MTFELEITTRAQEDMGFLDSIVANRIAAKLRFFAQQENPLRFAERLTSSPYGEYRFRVGDYRILFDVNARGVISILVILRIKHRREAY